MTKTEFQNMVTGQVRQMLYQEELVAYYLIEGETIFIKMVSDKVTEDDVLNAVNILHNTECKYMAYLNLE